MYRSFRFVPPEPLPDSLMRPRLLRALLGRWQHRVTAVTGGPGLGKTTLLAQAIAENRLAPRGEDVWIGIEEHDADADRLARVVATALAATGTGTGTGAGPEPGATAANGGDLDERAASWDVTSSVEPHDVAATVWQASPTERCIVLDDVHLLPAGSTGATWLGELVDALPANGHMVFASRSEPPIPLTRISAQGGVLRLGEDDLRFSDEEMSGFAARRGLDPARFGAIGGWPAMAELTARVQHHSTGSYLWEEVLEPLGTLRRHVLAVLCDLGGGDDHLVSAAIGAPVDLVRSLDGVPLVSHRADGWHVPHSLWRSAPGIVLTTTERSEIRRRAVDHLNERGRYDDAFSLLADAGLWEEAPAVLRSACLAIDRLVPNQLGRWLAMSTDGVRQSLAGQLASGVHTTYTRPAQAVAPLQAAAQRARADGDVDTEMAAIAHLGQLAWWRQDLSVLADLGGRVLELEPTGHPVAGAVAAIARALLADLDGDDATVVAELGSIESSVLDTVWEISAGWLCGAVHLDMGNVEAATEIVERLTPSADAAMRHIVDALRLRTWWRQGRVADVLEELPSVIADERRGGATYSLHLGQVHGSVVFSHAGDVDAGRRYLDDALATEPPPPPTAGAPASSASAGAPSPAPPDRVPTAQVASATASQQMAEGDEKAATATLRGALATHGLDRGQDRRAWRQTLALVYVLLPETREHWDAQPLRGYLRAARTLAAAVVELREGRGGRGSLRRLELPGLGVVQAALHHRLAAELAVGLATIGRPEGHTLLEMTGPAGRAAVRALGATSSPQAKPARSLLAAVPAPPPHATFVAVLGPLALRHDSWDSPDVIDPQLRRTRLQELIAFVIAHRRTSRAAITEALWPDLDERSAANNLGVTLNHLLRLLEPWRDAREPSYLLRLDGPSVQLVVGDHLHIDVDEFDRHLRVAAVAEADGAPSLALDHHLAAVGLYRDQLHTDLPESDLIALEREHYRTRFVSAAVRAGQLLLAGRDVEQAQAVAHRALSVDPWAEEAYMVLVGAALARLDRSAALRMLTRCLDALQDLGVEPSLTTRQLQRRLQTTDTDAPLP